MNRFTTSTTVALLTLALAVPAASQTRLTIAGGLNLASVAVSDSDDGIGPESVNRLVIGASAEMPMSERWGLHLGAGYPICQRSRRHGRVK